MTANTKEQIIRALRSTGRENIENVIAYMERNSFYTAACSGHHRYEGGLADHAWQVYQCVLEAEDENCKNKPNHKRLDDESMIICSILHDICKCGGMRKIVGHGLRSVTILAELGLHLSPEEYLAIRFHMSLKPHTHHPLYNDANHCHLRFILHNADLKSAKMYKGSSPKV